MVFENIKFWQPQIFRNVFAIGLCGKMYLRMGQNNIFQIYKEILFSFY